MKYQRATCLFLICLLIVTFSFVAMQEIAAQSNQLKLEKEQNWETYRVGGTCISGTGGNIFVGDVDDDGTLEILTGGHTYYLVNGTRTPSEAPLRIWNWNGQNLTLEKALNWAGRIRGIYADDADGDGTTEIITIASVTNITGTNTQLGVWQWNNQQLVLKASYESSISFSAVIVSDSGGDQSPGIITVGRFNNGTQYKSEIAAWQYDGNSITLKKSAEWGATNTSSVNSVYAGDVNGDGEKEIITGGYANKLTNSSGQLRVWQWNGEQFSLKANKEWRLIESGYGVTISGQVQGNTIVNDVQTGDIDGDGTTEIIAGGFAYNGEKIGAQLTIWNWNGQELTLEKSQEWITQDIVEVKAVSINDVDDDGRKEIVTSGGSGVEGGFADTATTPEMAQLRVWSWDGTQLTQEQGQDWYIDEGAMAQNVDTGDLDKDGVTEMVTVGCTYLGILCDPDMRIWSIAQETTPQQTAPPPYVLWATIGATGAAIALAAVFLWMRKKRQ